MLTRTRIARLVFAAVLLSVAPLAAYAGDMSGKWYDDSGNGVINLYKAGPEYSSSLAVTQGDIPAGSPHATPGHFRNNITEFAATDSHVHFKITETMLGSDDHILGYATLEYDLELSPEGARLIGTLTSSIFGGDPTTRPITLFKH